MKKKNYLLYIYITSIQAQVVIENLSSIPFLITEIAYESYDGVEKSRSVQGVSITISSKNEYNLSENVLVKPILNLQGVYQGKSYSFDVPVDQQFILRITPQQEFKLFAPLKESEDLTIKREFNKVRLA